MLPLRHSDLYHTGIVVTDVDAAKAELTVTLGITWGFEAAVDMPVVLADGERTLPFRMCYSADGPHRLELVHLLVECLADLRHARLSSLRRV